jgi:hypothetical protein
MASTTSNLEDRAAWKQLAERWLRCADWAEAERLAPTGTRGGRRRTGRIAGRPRKAA